MALALILSTLVAHRNIRGIIRGKFVGGPRGRILWEDLVGGPGRTRTGSGNGKWVWVMTLTVEELHAFDEYLLPQ